jgi:cytochrome c oxidase subunit III
MPDIIVDNYYNTTNKIHPLKYALWIGLASITMMFGAFTSAYVVRQAAGNWLEFALPNIFFASTLVLLISSLTLHMSLKQFKAANERAYKSLYFLSFVLGISFVVLQYQGWLELFSIGVDLKGNPAGSFLYIITGIHALHIIGGLAALIVGLINAFTLKFKITERRILNFELTLHYWHFVDLLWVYLLIFLYLSR